MLDKNRIIETELQHIIIEKNDFIGKILDVGGGGEGIMGKVYGEQAVCIDKLQDELDETKNEAEKIVMDACDLKFDDESFERISFFYTLMYMDNNHKAKALNEAYRVLNKNGHLEIWDTPIPEYNGGTKDVFITHLEVDIPDETIKTAYGVGIKDKKQSYESISYILSSFGLKIVNKSLAKNAFYICAIK